jgi:hypothetical protein
MTAGALYFQSRRLQRQEELHALAENVFYAMKSLELQMVSLQKAVAEHPDPQLRKQFEEKMQQQRQLQISYSDFARDELGISQDRLSEEEWLIYKVARIFGECDVSMPPGFVKTVRQYIRKWQSTDRLRKALERAAANGYAPKIAQAMLAHDMPPQLFYLALQESDFDLKRCGPRTRSGIAKGMWQFIPKTAMQYGLSSGPLLEWRRYDPRDERHDFEKSTVAAARYLRDIYQTEAQASRTFGDGMLQLGRGQRRAAHRALAGKSARTKFLEAPVARQDSPANLRLRFLHRCRRRHRRESPLVWI